MKLGRHLDVWGTSGNTGHRASIVLTFLAQPLKLYETEGAKREWGLRP